jgi:orotidine-5'-phosphate decarboxylase
VINPIIVALDVDDVNVAKNLVKKLSGQVGGFKIGPRLTFRANPSFIREIAQQGILFIDHKFFDIPSTTVASVRVAFDLGAHWVTVHALCGQECLKELKAFEKEAQSKRPEFRILAVTVLTSFSKETLPSIWREESVGESVLRLASTVMDSGLSSVVCSPNEIESIKEKFPNSFLVVPGIRPEGSTQDDQKRSATPAGALKSGASALVIGRPIIESSDPVQAVRQIKDSLTI